MVAVTPDDHGRGILGWRPHTIPFSVLASEATFRVPVFIAPFDCELGEVSLTSSTLVSGAATNNFHLNLIDGGLEGAGTTEIANLDLESGTDLIIGKTLLFDNIIGAALERFLAAGTIIELESEEIGTGLAVVVRALVRSVYRPSNLSS